MPLRSKASRIGGTLRSAGSAAIGSYREQKLRAAPPTPSSFPDRDAAGTQSTKQPGEQTQRYEILSSLIEGVYAADRGKENASRCWEAVGYEQEALRDEAAATDDEIATVGNSACKIRLMVFRRRDLADGAAARPPQEALPKYVIAIRGTRKYCQRDVVADIQILCETLHHNPLFAVVKAMTRRVVRRHSHDTVCVAGHSLGAAIGLIVTRELALEDMAVETHLFNPPFFSLETLVEKFTALGARGLGKLTEAFKAGSATEGPAPPSPPRNPGCRVTNFVRAKKEKRDRDYLEAMAAEFTKLAKWSPDLYVNPRDSICNGYIDYFRNQDVLAIALTAGSLRRFMSVDAQSYHLIPAAHLWINHRGVNLFSAHPLAQWHKYPTVGLRHETHHLLAEMARRHHDLSADLACSRTRALEAEPTLAGSD